MSFGGKVKRKDAVLVLGATGKVGQQLVRELLEEGRQVVAGARSSEKANQLFGELSKQHKGRLIVESGIDVTDKQSVSSPSLWQGVSQVALCVGPIFGRQDNGEMGYKGGMTSERVDAEGVSNAIEQASQMLQNQDLSAEEKLVIPMAERDLANWEKIDDVIMGGKSSSNLVIGPNRRAVWSGNLNTDGGGFCGTRNKRLKVDLSQYDGIQLRIRGDGQIYKVNLKTADRSDNPEDTYAATFATTNGDWQTVRIPFKEFVAVTRAKTNPNAPPLNTQKIGQIGFRLSRFDFNNLPNPSYRSGPFKLEFEGGISGYKAERPAVVLLSSAAVERNALIGDNEEARKRDIPIVALNPGGILNYKYKGEMALRSSGLPYSIVRPVGLSTEREDESFLMEASQGDIISGKISRAEVATVLCAALQTPASKGKTIEVRRSEAESSRGKTSTAGQLEQLFLAAVEDWQRPSRNLPPLPMVTEPPPPPSEARVKEILADPRVKEVAERAQRQNGSQNGATGNGSQPTAAKSSSSNGAQSSDGAESSNGAESSDGAQGQAREWIENWKERTNA